MNYHNDTWIMAHLCEHFKEAKTLIDPTHIVGIFIQGSQNYGLDHEDSDIDTKCIITPTFQDIALNHKSKSTTHIRANDEHIDLKDIRLYIQTFKKQNLNFLEILFTPYAIFPNKQFQEQWERLVARREEITHYMPVRSVKSMMGIAAEKYYALEHQYPSRMAWIEKFGYDPKQLHHLLRVYEYLQRYINGESYADCLQSKQADFLKAVKSGYYNLEEARTIGTDTYNKVHQLCEEFIATHKDEKNAEIDNLFDDVAYQIMKTSIKNDFLKEG